MAMTADRSQGRDRRRHEEGTVTGRGYGIGERNPATLPDGSRATESFDENAAKTAKWSRVAAEAGNPGGKYLGYGV